MSDLSSKANEFGKQLYKEYTIEEKAGRECGLLFLQWTMNHMFGLVLKEKVQTFKDTWELLKERGYDKNNKLVYGDMDVSVWYEKTKKKGQKVIATTRHCSCADDNTHLFILREVDYGGLGELAAELIDELPDLTEFLCVTVWPKEKASKGNHKWGDHRDIKIPSIHTYRRNDFNFGYEDARDNNYCFKLKRFINDNSEDALGNVYRIYNALWTLDDNLQMLVMGEDK